MTVGRVTINLGKGIRFGLPKFYYGRKASVYVRFFCFFEQYAAARGGEKRLIFLP
jgi:hypothetical protein